MCTHVAHPVFAACIRAQSVAVLVCVAACMYTHLVPAHNVEPMHSAVEASPIFYPMLRKNLNRLPVRAVRSFIKPENAVQLIQGNGLKHVDVFKLDIDSFDCDVLPSVLRSASPSIRK